MFVDNFIFLYYLRTEYCEKLVFKTFNHFHKKKCLTKNVFLTIVFFFETFVEEHIFFRKFKIIYRANFGQKSIQFFLLKIYINTNITMDLTTKSPFYIHTNISIQIFYIIFLSGKFFFWEFIFEKVFFVKNCVYQSCLRSNLKLNHFSY